MLSVFCFQAAQSQTSLYTTALNGLNDSSLSLQQYAGKKICFLIVPLQADSIYDQVQAFCVAHNDSDHLVVIGIPSKEDGYEDTAKDSLQQLYANLPIILTTGMYTRKSAGNNQGELLQWLTDATKNIHFDADISGIGQLFFVSETGQLYSVLDKGCSLDSSFINDIINTQVSSN